MTRLGIENISVFGLPPIEFVTLASDLGCQCISTGLTSFAFGVYDYAPFSLREDKALRREMIAVMRDRGVSISLGEGCTIRQGVSIDTMHLVRSGSGPADIAALDPELIDYVQVCDAPRESRFASYHEESMFERMAPGEGALGLRDLLAVLPRDRVFALEVPLRSQALAGVGPRDRLARCVEATRHLLAAAHGEVF